MRSALTGVLSLVLLFVGRLCVAQSPSVPTQPSNPPPPRPSPRPPSPPSPIAPHQLVPLSLVDIITRASLCSLVTDLDCLGGELLWLIDLDPYPLTTGDFSLASGLSCIGGNGTGCMWNSTRDYITAAGVDTYNYIPLGLTIQAHNITRLFQFGHNPWAGYVLRQLRTLSISCSAPVPVFARHALEPLIMALAAAGMDTGVSSSATTGASSSPPPSSAGVNTTSDAASGPNTLLLVYSRLYTRPVLGPSLLRSLSIQDCNLTGSLPPDSFWLQLPGLERLDLSRNQLSGPLPATFGPSPPLSYLNLSYNHLSGPLTASLARYGGCGRTLDLSYNDLRGGLPNHWLSSACSHHGKAGSGLVTRRRQLQEVGPDGGVAKVAWSSTLLLKDATSSPPLTAVAESTAPSSSTITTTSTASSTFSESYAFWLSYPMSYMYGGDDCPLYGIAWDKSVADRVGNTSGGAAAAAPFNFTVLLYGNPNLLTSGAAESGYATAPSRHLRFHIRENACTVFEPLVELLWVWGAFGIAALVVLLSALVQVLLRMSSSSTYRRVVPEATGGASGAAAERRPNSDGERGADPRVEAAAAAAEPGPRGAAATAAGGPAGGGRSSGEAATPATGAGAAGAGPGSAAGGSGVGDGSGSIPARKVGEARATASNAGGGSSNSGGGMASLIIVAHARRYSANAVRRLSVYGNALANAVEVLGTWLLYGIPWGVFARSIVAVAVHVCAGGLTFAMSRPQRTEYCDHVRRCGSYLYIVPAGLSAVSIGLAVFLTAATWKLAGRIASQVTDGTSDPATPSVSAAAAAAAATPGFGGPNGPGDPNAGLFPGSADDPDKVRAHRKGGDWMGASLGSKLACPGGDEGSTGSYPTEIASSTTGDDGATDPQRTPPTPPVRLAAPEAPGGGTYYAVSPFRRHEGSHGGPNDSDDALQMEPLPPVSSVEVGSGLLLSPAALPVPARIAGGPSGSASSAPSTPPGLGGSSGRGAEKASMASAAGRSHSRSISAANGRDAPPSSIIPGSLGGAVAEATEACWCGTCGNGPDTAATAVLEPPAGVGPLEEEEQQQQRRRLEGQLSGWLYGKTAEAAGTSSASAAIAGPAVPAAAAATGALLPASPYGVVQGMEPAQRGDDGAATRARASLQCSFTRLGPGSCTASGCEPGSGAGSAPVPPDPAVRGPRCAGDCEEGDSSAAISETGVSPVAAVRRPGPVSEATELMGANGYRTTADGGRGARNDGFPAAEGRSDDSSRTSSEVTAASRSASRPVQTVFAAAGGSSSGIVAAASARSSPSVGSSGKCDSPISDSTAEPPRSRRSLLTTASLRATRRVRAATEPDGVASVAAASAEGRASEEEGWSGAGGNPGSLPSCAAQQPPSSGSDPRLTGTPPFQERPTDSGGAVGPPRRGGPWVEDQLAVLVTNAAPAATTVEARRPSAAAARAVAVAAPRRHGGAAAAGSGGGGGSISTVRVSNLQPEALELLPAYLHDYAFGKRGKGWLARTGRTALSVCVVVLVYAPLAPLAAAVALLAALLIIVDSVMRTCTTVAGTAHRGFSHLLRLGGCGCGGCGGGTSATASNTAPAAAVPSSFRRFIRTLRRDARLLLAIHTHAAGWLMCMPLSVLTAVLYGMGYVWGKDSVPLPWVWLACDSACLAGVVLLVCELVFQCPAWQHDVCRYPYAVAVHAEAAAAAQAAGGSALSAGR